MYGCLLPRFMPYIMDVDEMISALDPSIPIYLDKLRVMTKGNQDKKIFNWINKRYPQYAKRIWKNIIWVRWNLLQENYRRLS